MAHPLWNAHCGSHTAPKKKINNHSGQKVKNNNLKDKDTVRYFINIYFSRDSYPFPPWSRHSFPNSSRSCLQNNPKGAGRVLPLLCRCWGTGEIFFMIKHGTKISDKRTIWRHSVYVQSPGAPHHLRHTCVGRYEYMQLHMQKHEEEDKVTAANPFSSLVITSKIRFPKQWGTSIPVHLCSSPPPCNQLYFWGQMTPLNTRTVGVVESEELSQTSLLKHRSWHAEMGALLLLKSHHFLQQPSPKETFLGKSIYCCWVSTFSSLPDLPMISSAFCNTSTELLNCSFLSFLSRCD